MTKQRIMKKRILRLFPRMKASEFRITSRRTAQYNCIAWTAGSNRNWWQPSKGYHWPGPLRNESVEAAVKMFESLGFIDCTPLEVNTCLPSVESEQGYQKIAIYGDDEGYTHAAKQLDNGKWSSKLGKLEDIEHDTLECLTDSADQKGYGAVRKILKRPHSQPLGHHTGRKSPSR